MTTRPCFNECGRLARPGHLTCEECERVAMQARAIDGTVAHAIAHLDDVIKVAERESDS